MKKVILFIATMLLVFCIVPIATTQAMPRKVPDEGTIVSNPPNTVLSVFNHKGLTDMITELGNQEIKDTILNYDPQEPRETTIAQSGKSTTTTSTGKTNPYVKRRDNNNPHVKRSGHGRSNMGDNVTEKDGEDDGDEIEENEESGDDSAVENSANDGDEIEENEESGDDSAINYNKGLKNSSGYNEDL